MYNKYIKYLIYKHTWNYINCLTLIELIYEEQLGIDFSDIWDELEIPDGTTDANINWFKKYHKKFLKLKLLNWTKISLQQLQEYDIILFKNRKGLINHFGMYIGENKFIHVEQDIYTNINELNEHWRDSILAIYRHNDLV